MCWCLKWSPWKSCNQRPDLACFLTSCRDSARLFDLNFTLYKGIARMTTFECKIILPKLGDIWKACWKHVGRDPSDPFICHHLSPPSLNHIESLCPCLLGLGDCVAERHDGGLLGAAEICVQTQTRQVGSWLAEDRAAQICCQTKMLEDWTRTARCTT